MKALLVAVNGKRALLAGCGDEGYLSFGLRIAPTSQGKQIWLTSYLSEKGTIGNWPNLPSVAVGDEVRISIIETDEVDPPDVGNFRTSTFLQRLRVSCQSFLVAWKSFGPRPATKS